MAVVFTLPSCEKDDNGFVQNLQLSTKSCVLDNEHSYVEVKKLKGTGFLDVTSSQPDVAEIRFDEQNKDIFYVIGHRQGHATITVADVDVNKTGDYDIKTIDVDVRESIHYGEYSSEEIYIKTGEFRIFKLPFNFDKNDSLVGVNDYIVSASANATLGNQFKVQAKSNGITEFQIYKGKIELFSIRIHVVNEYDLYIQERDSHSPLTLDLPFIAGANGISVWRGSGQYTARVVDETVAAVDSIIRDDDHFNQQNNTAAVLVTPLKSGKTKLIVTDAVTGQTSGVDIVVN
ncbi:hypothetical protein QUH73_07300 [Labilibaculum sp. K2S]|uniref:hypothetical protein n=1 Tax=Labilibaculum sp. K2S TaxID=3056386 RepID=UPI0025A406B7|nr:hypothetical protein [Labilibaculum sp. K2S]MDM8159612.1 hypothetical protein [Labilibaculum sp. K2S]